MKNKINRLLESWGVGNYVQGRHEQKRFRDDIADEILELFDKPVQLPENWRTFDCGVPFPCTVSEDSPHSSGVTLHWSPDSGLYHWNNNGKLSEGYKTKEDAETAMLNDEVKYIGNQISLYLRLGFPIDLEEVK